MVKGLQELIIRSFVHGKDRRNKQDTVDSKKRLRMFFDKYSRYDGDSYGGTSKRGGPWHTSTLSTWEFMNQSKVLYSTFFNGAGSYDTDGELNEESLLLSYFEKQEGSVEVSYINEKIKEIGFVEKK